MAGLDSVALAALVVGLVALVIASGQLLQQMFNTADGYRRCKQSVIGPWSKQTRLVWHWSQFRFETRFTTPEIVLYDWRAPPEHHTEKSGIVSVSRRAPKGIIDLDKHDLPYELRETIRPLQRYDHDYSSGDMVSWTSLLRQLYKMQSEWYQRYQQNPSPPKNTANIVGYGTKIGVIYQERTWDLMPPDLVRPMASSRLGTIIILAIRLGMKWENLDVGEGVLRAEGNGHTLMSTPMRGFGIVFQYNFNPDVDVLQSPERGYIQPGLLQQEFIPRRSTDMLACGILPGNSSPKIPAISLCGKTVGETAKLLSSALLWLNVPRSIIAQVASTDSVISVQQQGYESATGWPIHDMIALLSFFQPLPGSSTTQTVYPIQTNGAVSVFSLAECRDVLRRRLADYLRTLSSGRDHLREVNTWLAGLRTSYYHDFCCDWDRAIVNDPSAPIDTKIAFIEELRGIYNWTTEFFVRIEPQLKYTQLVAIHTTLATNAGHRSDTKFGSPEEYWVQTASRYVEMLHKWVNDNDRNISQILNPPVHPDLVVDAWWTLVLRGIVWRMSVYISHQESVVPSRFYYDQTPVYIL